MHNDPHYRRNKRIIIISLLVSMLVDLIPFSGSLFDWLPEFTALTLLYWLLHRSHQLGIGVAFIMGLLIDVGTASPLGQHALSYIVLSYIVEQYQRQIVIHDYGMQSVIVFGLLFVNEVILALVHVFVWHRFDGWLSFLAPFIGALLWPFLNRVMLSILNFRRFR